MSWQERTARIEQIPDRDDWLSAGERDVLRAIRGNRGSVGARLLAKRLIAACDPSIERYSQIHIESRDGRARSTRPQAYTNGRLIPWNISLSHSHRIVSAAMVPARLGRIGIDLVDLASLSMRRLTYWLTPAETDRAKDRLSMGVIWSLKEAIYKATNDGLSFSPRRVDTATFLSFAAWSLVDRDVRTRGIARGTMQCGSELSLHVIDETIKTLVWCPATRGALRTPA